MRAELVSAEGFTEPFTEQRYNGSLNIMYWNKKRGFEYQSTLYVCCWRQCANSVLRWE